MTQPGPRRHILIGYGLTPGTTGTYLEAALAAEHQVTYVGTPSGRRPGFVPHLDLAVYIATLPSPPDVFLYVDSAVPYLPRRLERLPCPTAGYLIDVHLGQSLRRPLAALFDHVFVAQKDYVELYQAGRDQRVTWLPLAADPTLAGDRLPEEYDVGFAGNVHAPGYERRRALLAALETRFRVNEYRRYYPRDEMLALYRRSRIVVNDAIGGDLNMRVFEALASGALLITNRIENGLFDLFRDREHLVTFASIPEAIDAVDYYLTHEEERRRIAAAGRAEVLARHTYHHRARALVTAVFATATPGRSPLREVSEDRTIALYARLYGKLRLLDPAWEVTREAFDRRAARRPALAGLIGAFARRLHG
ncbi:MAG TPA: glycosyltransferase [Dehalococcoidia bacterium]|nr:glycosyltransferase [Dehalococcoidia bacterium]